MARTFTIAVVVLTAVRLLAATAGEIGPIPFVVGELWWLGATVASVAAYVSAHHRRRDLTLIAGGIVCLSYAAWPMVVVIYASSISTTVVATSAHFALTGLACATLYAYAAREVVAG